MTHSKINNDDLRRNLGGRSSHGHAGLTLLRQWCMVAFALLAPPAIALADPGLDRFFQEIQTASTQLQAFSCDFTQERRLALFAEPVLFHGKLTVVRPDRLRWEFTSPVPSALIFDGKQGMRCNDQAPPVRFDLRSDPIMRTVAEQLWLWLGGDYSKLSDKYHLAQKDFSLIITPKDQATSEYLGTVTITFDPATKQPDQVLIAEPGGDSTLMRFSSYVLNGAVADGLFSSCRANE